MKMAKIQILVAVAVALATALSMACLPPRSEESKHPRYDRYDESTVNKMSNTPRSSNIPQPPPPRLK
jgi:hypothetical protein